MRISLLAAVVALAAPFGCAFPVDDFTVQDELAKDDGGTDAPDAKPAPPPPADGGTCACVERDKDARCKKWVPDKCGETTK